MSERYYRIYRENVMLLGGKPLSKDIYWRLIRVREKRRKILEKSGIVKVKHYDKLFTEKIESLKYLKYDKVAFGAVKTLKTLRKNNQLSLVTLRNSSINLREELRLLNLELLFDEILVNTNIHEGRDLILKAKLVKNSAFFGKINSSIIGDTEVDIRAGKILDIKTIAVSNGMRAKVVLLAEKPDFIIKSITRLPNIICNMTKIKE